MLVYLSIYVAAILEGEIYYIAMCVAAAAGKVNWVGVLVAGALGGSTGDQIWFYLLRGRIHWLDRYPWLRKHRDAVVDRVNANQTLMLLISRFPPGLRIAIPVACAYAGVPPIRFSHAQPRERLRVGERDHDRDRQGRTGCAQRVRAGLLVGTGDSGCPRVPVLPMAESTQTSR